MKAPSQSIAQTTDSTAAPADRREYRPWRTWQKLIAYAALLALALLSIRFIDRRVDALSDWPRPAQLPAR